MKDFFVSYTAADRGWAEWVAWTLEEAGYTSAIQAWDFRPGGNFVLDMQQAASEAKRTIAVLSPDYLKSRFTAPEWAAAFAQDPTGEKGLLLPVRVRESELRGLLPQIVYVDIVGLDEAAARERLLAGLQRSRLKPKSKPAFPGGMAKEKPTFPGATEEPGPTAPARRALLPAPPENFTGRAAEIERLRARLQAGDSIAISAAVQGMGGVGKSALALILAWALKDVFPGGAVWVSLGPQAKREAVTDRLAFDLGIELKDEPDPERRAARVRQALSGSGQVLAVVDDLWDLRLGRWVLGRLLPAERAVIVTSRKAQICRALCGQVERIDVLDEGQALELLAKLVGPLEGYEEAAREVVELAGRLPLAIKLVGALCEGGAEDLPRLARKLRSPRPLGVLILEGGEEREENLERCLALSYEELDEDGRRRFRALGAFAEGAFGLRALAAAWGDSDPEPAEDSARRLEGLALLARGEAPASGSAGGLVRGEQELVYTQHGLLRAYALSLACAAGEEPEAGKRHALYYAAATAADWRAGEAYWTQVRHAVRRIRDWPLDEQRGPFDQVFRFLDLRGRWGLYREWAEELLARAREAASVKFESDLLAHLGYIANAVGEKARALEYYQQALLIDRQVGDRAGEATTLNNIGGVYDDLGEKAKALHYYEQALDITRQVGDRAGEATTLNNIGGVYDDLGEKAQALGYYEQALPIDRQVGDRAGEAATLNNIGLVYDDLGEKAQALEYYEQALPITRQVGDRAGEARALNNIGRVYDARGEKAKALEYYEQALPISRQVGDRAGEAATLNNIGRVYDARGEKSKALEYYEQALPIRRQVGDRAGESLTLFNMASLHEDRGELRQAEALYAQVVKIDQEIGHPHLESHRKALERVRNALREGGET